METILLIILAVLAFISLKLTITETNKEKREYFVFGEYNYRPIFTFIDKSAKSKDFTKSYELAINNLGFMYVLSFLLIAMI